LLTQNVNRSFEDAGVYTGVLIAISDHGCRDTIVKPIVVGEDFGIWVPNVFTPNGDDLNDTFQPKGYGITDYQMMIFDRWGEKLYQTKDFFKGWDGFYKSQLCKEDTYVWKINVSNRHGKSKELCGIVTLLK
jgi:gliding motility-associated-like protein